MQLSNRHQSLLRQPPSQLMQGAMAYFANPYSQSDNPTGLINMGTAENRLQGGDMREKLNSCLAIREEDLLYGDFTGSLALRTEIADIFQRHFVLPSASDSSSASRRVISPEGVTVHNGCSATIEMLAHLLCDPGDGILVVAPLYGGFVNDVETRSGAKIVRVSTAAPSFTVSLEVLDSAMKSFSTASNTKEKDTTTADNAAKNENNNDGKVTAMIVCHPNNPLGQVYSREAVVRLAEWAKARGIWIIFDEIYALSTYRTGGEALCVAETEAEAEAYNSGFKARISGNALVPSTPSVATPPASSSSSSSPTALVPSADRFFSSLNLPDALYDDHVITVWGFSKDLAANGLRLGVTYSTNPQIRSGIFNYCIFTTFSRSLDRMVTAMLKDRAWVDGFWAQSNGRLNASYELLRSVFEKAATSTSPTTAPAADSSTSSLALTQPVFITPATAGFFVWVDFSRFVRLIATRQQKKKEGALAEDTTATISLEQLRVADERLFELFLENGVYIPSSRGFECSTAPGWYRIIFSMQAPLLEEGLSRIVKTLSAIEHKGLC